MLVVALGMKAAGKAVLGLWQGATENTTVVRSYWKIEGSWVEHEAALPVRD